MSFVVRGHGRHLAYAIGLVLPVAHVTVAFAQTQTGTTQAGTGGAGGGQAGGAAAGGVTSGGTVSGSSTSTTTTYYPGGVAPTPAGKPLGGGNTEFSSSRPITGGERDNFDFRPGAGGGGTAHGNADGSFIIGSGNGPGAHAIGPVNTPNSHVVRKGDTLWDICDYYFRNPYQWPRIWSYNGQIQNPHWIYPGDQVNLRGGGAATDSGGPPGGGDQAAPAPAGGGRGGIVDRRRQVPPDTVFLRNQGYIDEDTNNWGEISGAPEDKMILSDFDEVYIRVGKDRELKVGQELTVYRPVRRVGDGKMIEIQGTVKVDQWNAKDRIARARITESLDAIERGARVAPIARRFEVVPPSRNEKDVEATVLSSVQPQNLYGQHQVVFIDKGEEAGLKPGNRMFVIRKGDAWHQTHPAGAKRIALEDESPAATESVPKPRDESKLPEETMAELRVINVRKKTSMAVVTTSRREIESGDKCVARKGY